MSAVIKRPDRAEQRNAILAYERKAMQMPQVEIETLHRFAPGVYTREMIVPPDTIITGMIHKTEHFSIFLSGRMIVPDGDGNSIEIEGPIVEKAKPGIKRIGYTLTEVRWITVHATDETDIEKLEAMLLTNDFAEVEHLVDRDDYLLAAAEIGLDAERIAQYECIEVHSESVDGVEIRPSKRHGKGVFVSKAFRSGDVIAPAIKNGRLMEYSRYCNHSADPSGIMVADGDDFNLVARRDVENEEITVDYRNHARRLRVEL